MVWYYGKFAGTYSICYVYLLPEEAARSGWSDFLLYYNFPSSFCFCLVLSLKEQEQILTQATTGSACFNELLQIFTKKKTITTIFAYIISYTWKGEVLLKIKALLNALYVKSFDHFCNNTNPENINKAVFNGYSRL